LLPRIETILTLKKRYIEKKMEMTQGKYTMRLASRSPPADITMNQTIRMDAG